MAVLRVALWLAAASACNERAHQKPSGAPSGSAAGSSAAAMAASNNGALSSSTPPVADADAVADARRRSPIKRDETVVLFPAHAKRSPDGAVWQAEIHGWIFEREEDSRLRAKLVEEVVERAELGDDDAARKLARERLSMFVVDNERGKSISVLVAGKVYALPASSEDGHFIGSIEIGLEQARAWEVASALHVEALVSPADPRSFSSKIVLTEEEGLTIISDVDDTVKVTEVRDKRRLLRRTFAMPFEAVPRMADVFRRWTSQVSAYHYVSSSPWQLYGPLSEFMAKEQFPLATFDLKRIRPRDLSDTVESLLADPLTTKPPVIRALLERFPKRRFVFVGDSGEKDPEVYGLIARERPAQVGRIYIRDVTGEPRDHARYRAAFDGLPDDRWVLFQDAGSLPATP